MIENTHFCRILGCGPRLKVLMYLLENDIFDYAKTDISRDIRISRATLNIFWDDLLTEGLITKTRTVGKAELYQIDINNPIIKKLEELNNIICDIQRDKIVAEELQYIPKSEYIEAASEMSDSLRLEGESSGTKTVIDDFTGDVRHIEEIPKFHKKIITTKDITATQTTAYIPR